LHHETREVLCDEDLHLRNQGNVMVVYDSTNPQSKLKGVTLSFSDFRNEVTGPLGRAERFLRRQLRRHFRGEIEQYFEILKDLEAQNLPDLMPRHFLVQCGESGLFVRQTSHGRLVVRREVVWQSPAVSFTLVRAPKGHLLASPKGMSLCVCVVNGQPGKYLAGSLQEMLLTELSSFVKAMPPVRQPVTTR
jgi:hypothetical protein